MGRIFTYTVVNQQIDSPVIFELAVDAKVPDSEPRVCIQQWLNGAVFKADDCVFRRRHICKPQIIDGIQADLKLISRK